jgi:hypothetical protein
MPQPSLLSTAFRAPPGSQNYVGGTLAHDEVDLYFRTAPAKSPPGNVNALPLGGGPAVVLPVTDMSQLQTPGVIDVAATTQRGVLWLVESDATLAGPSWLTGWDGAKVTTIASFPERSVMLVADAKEAFVQTDTGLYVVSLVGGASTRLRSLPPISSPQGGPQTNVQLLGLNADALFYSPDGTTIVRLETSSGVESRLVTGALLNSAGTGLHNGWADSSALYYVTENQGLAQALVRVDVHGGTPEVIWDDPGNPPTGAVATDACNMYWLTGSSPYTVNGQPMSNGPSVLMVRRKS